MGSRFTNVVIVLCWIGAMTWLVKTKVLPPLLVGDPPSYGSILGPGAPPSVCWRVDRDGQAIGWAASQVTHDDQNLSIVASRVYFRTVPIDAVAPGWLGALARPVIEKAKTFSLEAKSRMTIDALGQLASFESRIYLPQLVDAIRINGRVKGDRFEITLQSGDIVIPTELRLAPGAIFGDHLSPLANLPGLRVGQQWTTPIYSPFRPSNPIEILEARVERKDIIVWNNERSNVLTVVYRGDAGSGLAAQRKAKSKLWVRANGEVLRQELILPNATLRFERLPDDESTRITQLLGADWWHDLPPGATKRVMHRIARRKP